MSPRERARLARPLGHSLSSSRAIRGLSPGEPERAGRARVVRAAGLARPVGDTLGQCVATETSG